MARWVPSPIVPPVLTMDRYTVTAELVVLQRVPWAILTDWAAPTVYTATSDVPSCCETSTIGEIDAAPRMLLPAMGQPPKTIARAAATPVWAPFHLDES